MLLIVIFLCCALSNICCADYIQEVKVRLFRDLNDNGAVRCTGIPSQLVISKPYRVHVSSPMDDIKIYQARCYIKGTKNAIVTKFVSDPRDQRLGYVSNNVSALTRARDVNFHCIFYTSSECTVEDSNRCVFYINRHKYTDPGIRCDFKVEVVKAIDIEVKSLGNMVTNQAVVGVSGTYSYYFHEGESAKFHCRKNTNGFVMLTYKAQDGMSFSTNYYTGEILYMYLKLTGALHNNTILMCSITTDYDVVQVIEMNLIVKPQNDMTDMIGLRVNGLLLPGYIQNGVLENEYYYHAQEIMTIEAVKDDHTFGDLKCYCENPTTDIPDALTIDAVKNHLSPLKSILRISLHQEQSNLYLHCKTQRLRDAKPLNTSVIFKYQYEDYSPYINGLTFARILMQYNDHKSNRQIHYEYTGNETLTLKCSDALGLITWLFTPTELIYRVDETGIYIQLHSHVNKSIVKCKSTTGKISSVQFIRVTKVTDTTTPAPVVTTAGNDVRPVGEKSAVDSRTTEAHKERSTGIQTQPTTITSLITSTISSTSVMATTTATITTQRYFEISSTTNPIGLGGYRNVIMAVISFIIFVLIITFVWAIIRLIVKLKRISHQSNLSDINYQNLPQHNEGPMPIPAQWNSQNNHYANTSGNIENLYAKPAPKNQRKPKLDPLYAQVRDSKLIDPTYASVQNTEPTYASVQNTEPTYASVQNTESTYASVQNTEPTYASVQNTESTYASVQNTESTYASVQNTESTYASVQNTESTYASVQNTESTYASVQNTESTYASVQNTESTYASVQNTDPTYAKVGKERYQNLSGQISSKDIQGPSKPQYAQCPRKNDPNYVNVAELKKGFNKVCGNGTYANVNLKK